MSIDFNEEIDESNTTIKYQVGSGTETDFTYTTDATIASGKCKETADSTDIYTCKYTVASGDTGLFKAKVSAFKDSAGNSGTAQTYNTTGITADTTAPTAPTGLDLDAEDDSAGTTGTNSDDYTNVTSGLTITGCAEDGSTVALYKGGTAINGATDTADGATGCTAPAKQFSVSISLAEGIHAITAKATDGASNTGTASTALSITVDTTAPTLTGGTLDLDAADDTGLSNTDNITKNTSGLSVSGTLSADPSTGDYIQLYNNGTTIASATDSTFTGTPARDWSIDIALANSTTPHPITAKVTDKAGNAGTATVALNITVDTTATTGTTTAPDLNAADDTGLSNTDNITSQTTGLTFTGTVASPVAGDYVQLYNGGTEITDAVSTAFTLNDSGNWTIDTSLTAGTHSITARVFDVAGNQEHRHRLRRPQRHHRHHRPRPTAPAPSP